MFLKTITLFSTLLALELQAGPLEQILKELPRIQSSVNDIGGLKSAMACSLTPTLEQEHEYGHQPKQSILRSELNNKNIPLTVLNLDEAKGLFTDALDDYNNDFSNPLDFCFARAHRLNQFLAEEKGIISGKAFLEGEFFIPTNILDLKEIGWFYHTATIVMVEHNGKISPYIFDHVLYDEPVPYDEWKKRITSSPKSKLQNEYFTDRFVYHRDDKHVDYREFNEDDLFDMNAQLKNGQRQAHMLDLGPKESWFK